MNGSVLQIISFAELIVGTIGSFVVTIQNPIIEVGYVHDTSYFNWGLLFMCLISTLILFFILFGLGTAIVKADEVKEQLSLIEKELAKLQGDEECSSDEVLNRQSKSIADNKSVTATKLENGRIECPNCGLIQPDSRTTCYECGTNFKK